jgi:hypothetical protein
VELKQGGTGNNEKKVRTQGSERERIILVEKKIKISESRGQKSFHAQHHRSEIQILIPKNIKIEHKTEKKPSRKKKLSAEARGREKFPPEKKTSRTGTKLKKIGRIQRRPPKIKPKNLRCLSTSSSWPQRGDPSQRKPEVRGR